MRGSASRTGTSTCDVLHLPRAPVMNHAGGTARDSGAQGREGMQQALDFIDAHLGERLTLPAIAGEVRLSSYHFARAFKRLIGVVPYSHGVQRRLELARQLFVHTELPTVAMAMELGYTNQSHFSEPFHRASGVTPLTYRLYR
jgi:AraC family transcriptional regulator